MLDNITTGTEYIVNNIGEDGVKELTANEGFWITDKVLHENSSFFKIISTKNIEGLGTVSDEDKNNAELIIQTMMAAESEE